MSTINAAASVIPAEIIAAAQVGHNYNRGVFDAMDRAAVPEGYSTATSFGGDKFLSPLYSASVPHAVIGTAKAHGGPTYKIYLFDMTAAREFHAEYESIPHAGPMMVPVYVPRLQAERERERVAIVPSGSSHCRVVVDGKTHGRYGRVAGYRAAEKLRESAVLELAKRIGVK